MKTKKKNPVSSKQALTKKRGQHADGDESNSKAQTASSTFSVEQLPLAFPRHLSSRLPTHDFLRNNNDDTSSKECFQAALETSYLGLAVEDSSLLSTSSAQLEQVLQGMNQLGYFQTDVTQPFGLGTKCAKTYVTRCLVGDFGTTYKYLGLRMFAHSWQPINSTPGGDTNICHELQTFKDQVLVPHTQHHLQELHQKRRTHNIHYNLHRSRPHYNICLINRMDSSLAPQNYKVEPTFEKDKIAVAWHADSSLEHFSNIAVFQLLLKGEDDTSKEDKEDCWSLAMRATPHAEGPHLQADPTPDPNIPPISLSLPSGSIYYMLDDFNHHHQHAVLCTANNTTRDNKIKDPKTKKLKSTTTTNNAPVNTTIRYSATYRLLRPSHTVQEVLDQCQSCCHTNFHKRGMKIWRSQQLLLSHVEFEWLRQFYIQGRHHYNMLWNNNWDDPIQQLWKYWQLLEHKTHAVISLLQMAAQGKCHSIAAAAAAAATETTTPTKAQRKLRDKQRKAFTTVQELLSRTNHDHHRGKHNNNNNNNNNNTQKTAASNALELLYEPMAELLRERAATRQQWQKREEDYVFTTMPTQFRPLPWPVQYECPTKDNDDKEKNHNDDDGDGLAVTDNDIGFSIMARSPLPGSPQQLLEIANQLVAFGTAFDSGKPNDLPACVIATASTPVAATAATSALNKETTLTSHSTTTTLATTTTSGITSSIKPASNNKKRKPNNSTASHHPKKQQWQKKNKNNNKDAETGQKKKKKRRY